MRHLFLVRHGKSSWDDPRLADFDRPLQGRGTRDARIMARVLAEHIPAGCILVSSPARRALDTAAILADGLDIAVDAIHRDERIYDADVDNLLTVIHSWNSAWERVVMVGHNPGFLALARTLSGNDLDTLPTCGQVHLTLAQWRSAAPGAAQLVDHDRPKNHR
jgi:phosphohistidine phosphatase